LAGVLRLKHSGGDYRPLFISANSSEAIYFGAREKAHSFAQAFKAMRAFLVKRKI
jgi:hypothetical protein